MAEQVHGKTSSLPCVKACLWSSTVVRFLLTNFPYAYSTVIAHDLNITSSTLSLILSLPTLLSIPMLFCAPVLIDMLGLGTTHIGMVWLELLGMMLFALGFYGRHVLIVLLGSCIMVPAMNTVNLSQKVTVSHAVDAAAFATTYGSAQMFKGLGAMAANFLLPQFAIQEALPVLVGFTLLDVGLNTCLSRSGRQTTKEPARGVCATLEKKMSPKALRSIPWKFWLIAGAYALLFGVNGQAQFWAYALQMRGGLSLQGANQIMGVVPLCATFLAWPIGNLFAKHERLRGPLFITAAVTHFLGSSVGIHALSKEKWLFDFETAAWILIGISQTILKCGSIGLLAETLKGRPELMPTASSVQAILGYATNSSVLQLSFAFFAQSFFEWRVSFLAVSVALMVNAVAITIFSPLAPDQGDTEDEDDDDDDDSTSSSDSKDA